MTRPPDLVDPRPVQQARPVSSPRRRSLRHAGDLQREHARLPLGRPPRHQRGLPPLDGDEVDKVALELVTTAARVVGEIGGAQVAFVLLQRVDVSLLPFNVRGVACIDFELSAMLLRN